MIELTINVNVLFCWDPLMICEVTYISGNITIFYMSYVYMLVHMYTTYIYIYVPHGY